MMGWTRGRRAARAQSGAGAERRVAAGAWPRARAAARGDPVHLEDNRPGLCARVTLPV